MKITINQRSKRIVKRRIKSILLNAVNDFRYDHPAPQQAKSVSDVPESIANYLWQGEIPSEQNFADDPIGQQLKMRNLTFSPPFVASLSQGRVFGKKGDVVTADNCVLTDINPEMSQSRHKHSLLNRGKMPPPQRISGSVAVLNAICPYNYYHWTFDVLGRLRFLQKIDYPIDYYYTNYDTKFQQQLLDLFGIPASRIIKAEKDTHLIAERLLVTSLPGDQRNEFYSSYKDENTYRFIRDTVLNKVNLAESLYEQRIVYVQRRGNRVIANEDQLIEKLTKTHSCLVVRLEEHSVSEQINIFHHARAVIAMHGAGLTNLVYCKPGTTVIEIHNPYYRNPLYYQLAYLMKLNYRPVIGEENSRSFIHKKHDVRGNVRIDSRKVAQQLESCLALL